VSKLDLEVTVSDAFEVGQIEGARKVMSDINKMDLKNPRLDWFLRVKLSELDSRVDLLTKKRGK
jgi:hypothetical protein